MIPLSSNKKMILSKEQIEMINIFKSIISSWNSSNDVTSPTVNSDIDEELQKIDFNSDVDYCQCANALRTLLHTIINLK